MIANQVIGNRPPISLLLVEDPGLSVRDTHIWYSRWEGVKRREVQKEYEIVERKACYSELHLNQSAVEIAK